MFSSVQIVVCSDDLNGEGGDLHPGQPTSRQLVPKLAQKNAPAWRDAIQMRETVLFVMYWEISPSQVCCPSPKTVLFLVGDNLRYGKEK